MMYISEPDVDDVEPLAWSLLKNGANPNLPEAEVSITIILIASVVSLIPGYIFI